MADTYDATKETTVNEENIGTLARILSEMSPEELRLLAIICNKVADLGPLSDWPTLTNELRPFLEAFR